MASYKDEPKKFIFNAYRLALGTGQIKEGFSKNNIVLSWVLHEIPTTIDMNDPNLRYGSFMSSSGCPVQLASTYLNSVNSESINELTFENSDSTYQEICHIPASDYLFKYDDPHYTSACPVTKAFGYDKSNTSERQKNAFVAEYNLVTDAYSESNYLQLNIPQDELVEGRILQRAADVNFHDDEEKRKERDEIYGEGNGRQRDILAGGAIGYILSYKTDEMKYEDMIPMEYYQFENPILSNDDTLKVKWNENGFLEAK